MPLKWWWKRNEGKTRYDGFASYETFGSFSLFVDGKEVGYLPNTSKMTKNQDVPKGDIFCYTRTKEARKRKRGQTQADFRSDMVNAALKAWQQENIPM